MKLVIAALFTVSLAACGGKSQPAATAPEASGSPDEQPADGNCCCEFVAETGDGDEMAEELISRMMTNGECDENSGTCVGNAACIAPS